MSIIKRYFIANAAYFITTNTKNRIKLFNDSKNCDLLLITIEYFKLVLDYKIYGFCLMPDHIHLIIHPFGKYTIAHIMKMVKGNFARKINKRKNTFGTIWQKSFYNNCILSNIHLIQKLSYIHNNPAKAGIVNTPEEYFYSSYNYYIKSVYPSNPIIKIDTPAI